MGMYDYLMYDGVDIQVKCFYHPNIYKNELNEYEVFHSGGEFRDFLIGTELPLKTLYYEYPDTCYIHLNTSSNFERYGFAKVVDRKLHSFIKTVDDIIEFLPIISKNGIKLNVSSVEELREYEEGLKKWNALLVPIIYDNDEEAQNFIKNFQNKWYAENTDEEQLGEYFYCLKDAIDLVDLYPIKLKHAVALTEMIDKYRIEKPSLFYSFLEKHNLSWGK